MSRTTKIKPRYHSCLMGIEKNKAGYWGNHGVSDNGSWMGYIIVFGILIVSFFFIVLIG